MHSRALHSLCIRGILSVQGRQTTLNNADLVGVYAEDYAVPSIRRIANKSGVTWRAEIYVNGVRESKRFNTKPAAVNWALEREAFLSLNPDYDRHKTVNHALERYQKEHSVNNKGARAEKVRIRRLSKDKIARIRLEDLSLADAEDYRDRRLAEISPGSVIRELNVLKAAVRRSVRWGWCPEYPWSLLETPKAPRARTRVFTQNEIDLIVETAGFTGDYVSTSTGQTAVMFLIAIETAMRQGELAGLLVEHLDLDIRVAHLPDTKNGTERNVPLSRRAVELFCLLPKSNHRVFTVSAATASTLFRRVTKKAGVKNCTFHDSRRTATVRLSKKVDVLELARITGHLRIDELLTYYQRDAAELAKLLD